MPTKEQEHEWIRLPEEAMAAEQHARNAEAPVMAAFRDCAAGRGTGPTTAQMEVAGSLRAEADRKRVLETAFLKSVFG